MRNSETRYRRLFESATDGILILDAHTGKITDANACMGVLMETESHELLGKELWEIGLVSDKSASEAAVRELQARRLHPLRATYLSNPSVGGGSRSRLSPTSIREDRQSVVQCNIRDITERSRLERKTQEQAAALADLDRRKDEFLAMLSHELRNPLAPIRNALNWSASAGRNRSRRSARLTKSSNGRSKTWSGWSMTCWTWAGSPAARSTSGRSASIWRPSSLAPSRAPGRSSTRGGMRWKSTSPMSPSRWRPTRCGWRKSSGTCSTMPRSTPQTGGRITLEVERGDGVVVRIRDTGMGIAPEMLPKVFDRFIQMDRALDRAEGGMGIGLTLVRRLTEMHGGTVAATSEGPGQGSEFVVRLPALPDDTPPAGPTLPTPAERRVAPTSGRRILVVDDNRDSAESLAMLLRLFGYDVRTAQDGRLALEVAAAYRPGVVLLDIGLPSLDGLEVCRRLRADRGNPAADRGLDGLRQGGGPPALPGSRLRQLPSEAG